jgi:hypothetical protein
MPDVTIINGRVYLYDNPEMRSSGGLVNSGLMSRTTLDGFPFKDVEKDYFLRW